MERLPAAFTTTVIEHVLAITYPTLSAMQQQQAGQTFLQAREMAQAEKRIKILEKDLTKAQENIVRMQKAMPNAPQWLTSTANKLENQRSSSGEVLDKKEMEKVLTEICKHKFSLLEQLTKDIDQLKENARLLQSKYEKYAAAIGKKKSQVKQEPAGEPVSGSSRNVSADSVVPSNGDDVKPYAEESEEQEVGHVASGPMYIDADIPMPSIEHDARANTNDSEGQSQDKSNETVGRLRIVKLEYTPDS